MNIRTTAIRIEVSEPLNHAYPLCPVGSDDDAKESENCRPAQACPDPAALPLREFDLTVAASSSAVRTGALVRSPDHFSETTMLF